MKQRFPIYLIFLATVLACSKENYPIPGSEDNYIRFASPGVIFDSTTDTRAMVNGTTLPNNSTFGVWGYNKSYRPSTTENVYDEASTSYLWDRKSTLCPPNVFSENGDMLTVTNGAECTYNNTKEWESESSLYSFLGIYPSAAVENTVVLQFPLQNGDKVNAPKVVYTVPVSDGQEIENYNDLIPDVMVGWVKDHKKAYGSVKFSFYHMMSSLSVRVNNYSKQNDPETGNPTGKVLKIYSIKLSGSFYKTLTVDMANGGEYEFTDDKYTATYLLYKDDAGTEVSWQDNEVTLDIDESSMVLGNPLMLLCGKPGDLTNHPPYGPNSLGKNSSKGDQIKLIVKYKFAEKENIDGSEYKESDLPLLNPDLSFTPRVGVNYTFQLNWVGQGDVLLVMPASNPQWEDGEMDDGESDNDDVVFE